VTGLRLELRRLTGPIVFVAVLIFGVKRSFQTVSVGAWSWPEAVVALGQSGLTTGPIVIAVGAWAGGRAARSGALSWEKLSSRGPVTPGLTQLLALLIWVAAAYLAVMSIVFVKTGQEVGGFDPTIPRTIATGAGLLALAAVGYGIGRLLPYRLTPLVVGFAVLLGVQHVISSQLDNRWELYLPDSLQDFDEFSSFSPWVPIVKILWYAGVSGVVLSGWALVRGRTWRHVAATGVSMIAAVTGFVIVGSYHGLETGRGVVVKFDCAGSNPQLCLNPELNPVRAKVEAVIAPIVSQLAGTPFAIHRLEHRPRGVGQVPTPGAVAFALDDRSANAIALIPSDIADNSINPYLFCTTNTGTLKPGITQTDADVIQTVENRLEFGAGTQTAAPSHATVALTSALGKADTAEFRAFLTKYADQIRTCQVPADATP
jgi:hypothetical protein